MSASLLLTLPEFLHESGGEICVVGHRITLFDVLWEYNRGMTIEELTIRFPTIKRSTLHKVIAFYLDNQPAVDVFLSEYAKTLDDARVRGPQGPSLAELQGRMEQIRRSANHAAQVSH